MQHEKRAHTRVPVNVDVNCATDGGENLAGVAKDISLGGMFIESEATPEFGTKVTITARLPGAPGEMQLPGVVRWAKPGGFGVQFGLLGARETHVIAGLLKH